MAQSTLTVTPNNPTPPTNFGAGYVNAGKFTPGPPTVDYAASVYNDPWHPGQPNPTGPLPPNTTASTLPPYLDDGVAASGLVFAAPASGTAAEGAGTEVAVTQSYSPSIFNPAGPLIMVSDLGNYTDAPNRDHASSLSPATNPALASIAPASTASGVGQFALTATGTNLTKQSVIYVNGVAQACTYGGLPTSVLATSVTRKAAAGTWNVTVVTGGVVTAAQVLTFT
jgi:hypothetical protein